MQSVIQGISLLTCPHCQIELRQTGTALTCTNGHTFDMAREGYVNLLLQKRTGDAKEMLRARRSFLEGGLYAPLSDAVNELVRTHLQDVPEPLHILDAGCGEGYYLDRLRNALAPRQNGCYTGMDVSKEAIRMAAKRYRQLLFVVADVKQRLVLADQTIHAILNIFAPRNASEFARVSSAGGILIVVIPGPEHLLRLRSTLGLLGMEEQKQQRVEEQFAGHFELVKTCAIAYSMHLNREAIEQVVMMTPNYWHMTDEIRQAMQGMEEIETEVDFTVMVFRRK
ncbi:MAG TPA: methyltransferase domain-containing protein [Ktedonobacteraceae bacterium]|nr:methyltransferase domain-containing protein [Ktedonobacteraceae bacterium]